MSIRVSVRHVQGGLKDIFINQQPDYCPCCHCYIEPSRITGLLNKDDRAQLVYKCTRNECPNLFIATYYLPSGPPRVGGDVFELRGLAPHSIRKEKFPDTIQEASPIFSSLYNEAFEAEKRGLRQICGAGYRKALEFLIKDYIIYKSKENPNSSISPENIATTKLAVCIDKYIEDRHIKECARRAAWLGNDETHYYRKWEDKDLQDLKTLITLTVNGIDSNLLADRYKKDMP